MKKTKHSNRSFPSSSLGMRPVKLQLHKKSTNANAKHSSFPSSSLGMRPVKLQLHKKSTNANAKLELRPLRSQAGAWERAIFLGLISLSFATYTHANDACQHATEAFAQAQNTGNIEQVESALSVLNSAECPNALLQQAQDQVHILRATQAIQSEQYDKAKQALDQVKEDSWNLLATRGDLFFAQKDYTAATARYAQAYTLAVNNNKPSAIQKQLYDVTEKTQLLAGTLDSSINRSGNPQGIFAHRGFKPQAQAVPVEFEYNSSDFTTQGKKNAQRLARMLAKKKVIKLRLIGHTDPKGGPEFNQGLSERRAQALMAYLQQQGLKAEINTIGKGESQALDFSDPRYSALTTKEQHQMLRRVEFEVLGQETTQ